LLARRWCPTVRERRAAVNRVLTAARTRRSGTARWVAMRFAGARAPANRGSRAPCAGDRREAAVEVVEVVVSDADVGGQTAGEAEAGVADLGVDDHDAGRGPRELLARGARCGDRVA